MQTEYDTARNPEVNREAELVRAFDSKAMMEKVDTLIGKVSALGQVVPQQKERADHLLDRIKASESVIDRLSHEVAEMQNEPVQGIGKLQAEVDTLTDRVDLLADLQALDIDERINSLDDQLGAFVKWVGERLSDVQNRLAALENRFEDTRFRNDYLALFERVTDLESVVKSQYAGIKYPPKASVITNEAQQHTGATAQNHLFDPKPSKAWNPDHVVGMARLQGKPAIQLSDVMERIAGMTTANNHRDTLTELRHAEIMEVLHRMSMERPKHTIKESETVGGDRERFPAKPHCQPTMDETLPEQAPEDSEHFACKRCGWRMPLSHHRNAVMAGTFTNGMVICPKCDAAEGWNRIGRNRSSA